MNGIRGHITNQELSVLMQAASKVAANGVIVEIGSYCGKSTVAMASVAKAGVFVWAVDPWEDRTINGKFEASTWEEFLRNTRKHENIFPRRGKSHDIVNVWTGVINMLFIDGDHTEEGVYQDLTDWVPHVTPGGLVLLHDYTEKCCGVRAAWERFAKTCDCVKGTSITASILKVQF